jgi:hypothetical protein
MRIVFVKINSNAYAHKGVSDKLEALSFLVIMQKQFPASFGELR